MPAIARPQAILFDLDDTMWPIAPVIAAAEQRVHAWLAQHAPRVAAACTVEDLRARRLALLGSDPVFAADLGALRRAGLELAFREHGEDCALLDAAMDEFHAARNAVTLWPDVLPVLSALRPHVRLGTLTNGNANLAAIGLDQHFELSLSAREVGVPKPDPAIFHAACAALGLAPAEVLYVGDDLLLDVRAAQAAGLRAAWMRRQGSTAALAHGVVPDLVCTDFHDLLAWLHTTQA
ncbi:HAD family hydrolase [Massilia sp. TS11]|nr:HAD family hydrolase [Massilia sp. TS11]